ncbi:MAG: major facilitator superfamily domain-containing protein [Podila humilis]|nr:MAG: major facilitator superfamily domain-containing protein [Podila humilis]
MASSSSSSPRGTLPHYPSDTAIIEEEDSPLLPKTSTSPSQPPTEDPTVLYVKILDTLPWHKRPSTLWLVPFFVLLAVSGGMLSSSTGQYHASLLCRQFFTHYTPANATLAAIIEKVRQEPDGLTRFLFDAVDMEMNGMVVPLLPVPECRQPDIQGYTAKIMALLAVLNALTGTLSIGYYSSLSDKYGRIPFLLLTPLNTLWLMGGLIIMGTYWDEVGLYVMFTGMVVSGLLGGFGVGATMSFAYAADCTDPSKRSTRFSWIHAALFFGLTVGPVMGGALAIATKTIMTIIYIEIVATIVCLAYIAFVVPESLPSRQSPQIRALYEQALQASRSSTDSDKDKKKEDGSWYSHVLRSLQYFKPTGKNTNLILLASMSFMSTLAMKGTLTVMILYTNKVFHWTQKEDGILSSSSSSVRLMTLLVILPILGHYYRKHTEKTLQEGGGNGSKDVDQSQQTKHPQYHSGLESEGLAFDPNDSTIAASVEHLGEAALQLSEDDEDEQEAKERQRRQSAASTRSWETDRTQIPASSSSSPRSPASNSTQKPKKSQESPSSTPIKDGKPARSASQVRADMRFDIWMIRLGFVISCTTYIGYGLATQGWMFYIWSALHAVSIVGVPSLRSLLTNLVEPSEFGAILGAIQVVDSISGIVSPVVVSWVYAATVEDRPEAVWYTIAAATGVCTVLAFMVRQKEFRREVV